MTKCIICGYHKTFGELHLKADIVSGREIKGRICYICLGEICQTIEECKDGHIRNEIKIDDVITRKK